MYKVFTNIKANKKPTNKKTNPLDYINIKNFYPLNKLLQLKGKWKMGNICHHYENEELVLKYKNANQ